MTTTTITVKDVQISLHEDISVGEFGLAGRAWPAASMIAEYFLWRFSSSSSSSNNNSNYPAAILELGSGTGVAGILLGKILAKRRLSNLEKEHGNDSKDLKCQIVITDLPEVVPLIQTNIDLNTTTNTNDTTARNTSSNENTLIPSSCVELLAKPLAWGEKQHALDIQRLAKFNIIFAADVVYFPHLFGPLIQTLCDLTELSCAEEIQIKAAAAAEQQAPEILLACKFRELNKELPFYARLGKYFHIEAVGEWAEYWDMYQPQGFVFIRVVRRSSPLSSDTSEDFEAMIMSWTVP